MHILMSLWLQIWFTECIVCMCNVHVGVHACVCVYACVCMHMHAFKTQQKSTEKFYNTNYIIILGTTHHQSTSLVVLLQLNLLQLPHV